MAAEMFGPYRCLELIGRGGMGEVWRAYDTRLDRTVALKRISAPLAAEEDFHERFRRESRLAAQLSEPHIIPIHDFGAIDGRPFIDMRLVEGIDLASLIAVTGPMPPARAVSIVSQLASALDAAHAAGLVHRDIKPSNTLVVGADCGRDYVYLIDFGIARAAGGTGITGSCRMIGSLDYMAPERWTDGCGDHRVDIYSLACVLFEALTASKPFACEGMPAQMYAHVHSAPPVPSLQRAGIPRLLDDVVTKGMAKKPAERYSTAGDLAAAARAALIETSDETATQATLTNDLFVSALAAEPSKPDATYIPPPQQTSDDRLVNHTTRGLLPSKFQRYRRLSLLAAAFATISIVLLLQVFTRRGGDGGDGITSQLTPVTAAPPNERAYVPVPSATPLAHRASCQLAQNIGRPVDHKHSNNFTMRTDWNVSQNIESDPHFIKFAEMLRGWVNGDTLSSGGPFTVFLPTDNAYTHLSTKDVHALDDELSRDEILSYNIIKGACPLSSLHAGMRLNAIEYFRRGGYHRNGRERTQWRPGDNFELLLLSCHRRHLFN
jgi:serine/threonine protein kinase